MTENIKKFRDEAKKLEESDALQQARRKYVSVFGDVLHLLRFTKLCVLYNNDI